MKGVEVQGKMGQICQRRAGSFLAENTYHTAEEASYIPMENLCKMIQQVISALRGEKPLMFLTDWKEKPAEQNTPCPPLHRIRVSPEDH